MSEKDKIIQLLDYVPEYKLGYVLAYVKVLLLMKIPMTHTAVTFTKII